MAQGGTVEVAVTASSSRTELVPVAAIPGHETARCVSGRRRPVAGRAARATGRKKRITGDAEAEPGRHYRPYYEPEAGTVQVGRMRVQIGDLLRELASVSGPDHPPVEAEEYVTVKTRLTPAEAKRLLEASTKAELPEWEMIRKALRAFGLI